ncbi:Lysophospholipase, alpha-beta hydrolase superfamily [Lachnospiraceae bacterium]|nr:Lysophospholipase, alpha-beta hydrolase superfamily [Lachnospiraceae bacterium]
MYKPEVFTIDSRDGKTKLHCEKLVPSGKVRAILIVAHGMNEYFDRYHEMSEFLEGEGILVAGLDHLGHGHTAEAQGESGYFADRDGATVLVRDVHRLKKTIESDYPGVPVFVMGHSMGSFIIRNYINVYGRGIKGAILMGSGWRSVCEVKAGRILAKFMGKIKGRHSRSLFLTALIMKKYGESFPVEDGPLGWICSIPDIRNEFEVDPLRGDDFTIGAYNDLIDLALRAEDFRRASMIPSELPLLLLSGEDDPVGDFGKGVEQTAQFYRNAGIRDVIVKLYKGNRHEVYHDRDRYASFMDIIHFMEDHGVEKAGSN